ncbi:hypothetical protein [Salicibibacter halophilus]|nr:hypothetical protein [Salicibibacter halophilus]
MTKEKKVALEQAGVRGLAGPSPAIHTLPIANRKNQKEQMLPWLPVDWTN